MYCTKIKLSSDLTVIESYNGLGFTLYVTVRNGLWNYSVPSVLSSCLLWQHDDIC